MILIIFQKVRDLLAMAITNQRQLETLTRQSEAQQRQLDRIERKLGAIADQLEAIGEQNLSELEILDQLQDAIIPGPAVRLELTAGPIEEQPI